MTTHVETTAAARTGAAVTGYWVGFAAVLTLLAVAPLVLPPFWQRFVTEILIWGLLAMSSDILIGYTGMVSFGHSAFFGLGMYGAAAALLTTHSWEERPHAQSPFALASGPCAGCRLFHGQSALRARR